MIILDKNNVMVSVVDKLVVLENGLEYYYDTVANCYYQKNVLELTHTEIQLPNESWALPQQAKLVDGVWVQNPDYIAPEQASL